MNFVKKNRQSGKIAYQVGEDYIILPAPVAAMLKRPVFGSLGVPAMAALGFLA